MQISTRPARTLILMTTAALALGGCSTTRYEWKQVPGQGAVHRPPPPPPPVQEFTPPSASDDFAAYAGDRVFFDTDKSVLKLNARQTLDRQAEWLNRHPEVTARIEGNADQRGTPQYNEALGQRRAEAVRDYLVSRGVAASRISMVSYGLSQPIEPGRSPQALARNRNARTVVITAQGY